MEDRFKSLKDNRRMLNSTLNSCFGYHEV